MPCISGNLFRVLRSFRLFHFYFESKTHKNDVIIITEMLLAAGSSVVSIFLLNLNNFVKQLLIW